MQQEIDSVGSGSTLAYINTMVINTKKSTEMLLSSI